MITAKKHPGSIGVEVKVDGYVKDNIDELAAIVLSLVEQRKADVEPKDMLENIITVVYKLCTANLHNRHITLSKGDTEQ